MQGKFLSSERVYISIRVLGKKFSLPQPRPACPDLFVLPPSSVASERAFIVAKNVLGDTKLGLRPENVEMNLFFEYNEVSTSFISHYIGILKMCFPGFFNL